VTICIAPSSLLPTCFHNQQTTTKSAFDFHSINASTVAEVTFAAAEERRQLAAEATCDKKSKMFHGEQCRSVLEDLNCYTFPFDEIHS
jgi:hypothetical protein